MAFLDNFTLLDPALAQSRINEVTVPDLLDQWTLLDPALASARIETYQGDQNIFSNWDALDPELWQTKVNAELFP